MQQEVGIGFGYQIRRRSNRLEHSNFFYLARCLYRNLPQEIDHLEGASVAVCKSTISGWLLKPSLDDIENLF